MEMFTLSAIWLGFLFGAFVVVTCLYVRTDRDAGVSAAHALCTGMISPRCGMAGLLGGQARRSDTQWGGRSNAVSRE